MQRISTKMKLLSLAILGLGGIALAGSAAAQSCPSTPDAWSGQAVGGGSSLSIVSGGYVGTSCKLQSSLGNSGVAIAAVRDDSPTNEPRYRSQFLFDPSSLLSNDGNIQTTIFTVNAGTAYSGHLYLLRVIFAGSGGTGTKRLFIVGSCDNGSSGICVSTANLPVQNGVNRIEFDLQTGASGAASLRYWLSDPTTSTSDTSPTGTLTLTGGNQGWGGVETVFLGLSSPTATYRSVNTGTPAWFDQFDSRRQTFIGG